MKKVLVTGATGFIGNYVITQLLQKNCLVIASSSSIENARKAFWFDKVTYIPFNLNNFDNSINYYDHFHQPDAMIHLAWQGLPNYKADFHTTINLPLQYNFLKNIIVNGCADITVTGTCFEYGMQEGCLSEDMETKPANAYAIAKDNLRKKLQQLQLENTFQLKWIRLFYMYGSGQSANSLLSQLDKALENGDTVFNMSGGEQQRDYLPVEKVAENIITISLQKQVDGIINCCSGEPVKVKTFVQNYLLQHNKNIHLNLGYYPYADFEPMHFWGDNKKLNKIISNA